MSFSTTYHKVHDLHGQQKGPGGERRRTTKHSYNVITGKAVKLLAITSIVCKQASQLKAWHIEGAKPHKKESE